MNEFEKEIRKFLAEGIMEDQSGQDMVEYTIGITIAICLGIILYRVLQPMMENRAQEVDDSWIDIP